MLPLNPRIMCSRCGGEYLSLPFVAVNHAVLATNLHGGTFAPKPPAPTDLGDARVSLNFVCDSGCGDVWVQFIEADGEVLLVNQETS